jgi:putative hydrolase of the HAD superfamily
VFVDPRRLVPVLTAAGADAAERLYWDAEREARVALCHALRVDGPSEDLLWRDYFMTIFRGTGVPEERLAEVAGTVRDLHRVEHLWTHVPDGAAEAIARVRELGYRVAVVSNADGRVEALLEALGLARMVEFVIDSHAVGFAKPDPRIFRLGVERLGLTPSEGLYVGDLYAVDVVGARAAGLRPLLLDPFDRFAEWDDVERIPTVCELPRWLERRAAAPR